MFQPITFNSLLDGLIKTRQWLEGLNIKTSGTRLEAIEDVVGKLVEGGPDRAIKAYGLDRVYYALCDGNGFVRIASALGDLRSHEVPRGTLTRALAGPLCPAEEEIGSPNTEARNVAAELQLAADLSSRGVKPTGFDDVTFHFEGRTTRIEVKRPGSAAGVGWNLGKAREKLRRQLKTNEIGLVAVEVDRVFELYRHLTKIRREEGLDEKVKDLTDRFLGKYRDQFELFVDPRIAAVLLLFRFLVITVPENTFGTSYHISVIRLVNVASQPSDHKFLQRLVRKLNPA